MRPTGIVYPADYFKPHQPDSTYAEEAQVLRAQGLNLLTWDAHGLHGSLQPGRYLYRGWMQTGSQYAQMYAQWSQQGLVPCVSPEAYALCHYLPNWYAAMRGWTPETERLELDGKPDAAFAEELTERLRSLQAQGWSAFFLKDDVKSLKTGRGSLLKTPEQATQWLKEFCQYRELEGGVCIRRVETWQLDTECRWFVWREQAFGPEAEQHVPAPVQAAVEKIDSPFFSVDIVKNEAGDWRLVELGDGQVSDLVGWQAERFGAIWR